MLSGRDTGQPSSIVPFISIILAKIVATLYSIFGIKISIFGLLLIGVNIVSMLVLLNLSIYLKDFYKIFVGLFIIVIILPTTLISPTFTITSLLAQGIGCLALAIYRVNDGKNTLFYIANFFLVFFGFLIRPETFFGILLFIFPLITLYLLINDRRNYKFLFNLLFFYAALNIIEKVTFYFLVQENTNAYKYLQFTDLRGSLSFTPAFLKAQQLVIAGEVNNSPLSNVDFILLQNWHVFDRSVFNYDNLIYIVSFVSNSLGIKGFFNSNFFQVLERFNTEANSFYQFFIVTTIVYIILAINMIKRNNFIYFTIVMSSYAIGFYYLSAVARLPYRTIFPFAILLVLSTFLLFNLNFLRIKKLPFVALLISLGIFTITFHINDEFGFKKVISNNNNKIKFFKNRDDILFKELNKTDILLSPIDNLPISIQGTLFKNLNWNSSTNLISIDWSVNSPSWDEKVRQLGLDSQNLFNSLAKNKNLYYGGNDELAQVLDFYMNDRKILRGKLCKVRTVDNLNIYTYQAKETDC
jgi:hypothetical protein